VEHRTEWGVVLVRVKKGGDSVSITAATQPSIDDVLLSAIPGLPRVYLHDSVLAYENGDDFLKYWYDAE
jgi:hydrogenase small subunit